MNLAIAIFWASVSGTIQACYKEAALAQVCVAANGTGKHDFTGLKFDTDYVFSYKADGVESDPLAYRTPKKKLSAPSLVAQQ